MNLTEEISKYRAVINEAKTAKDHEKVLSNFEKEIAKTEREYLHPKTAFKKKKKTVKEDRFDDYADYAGWDVDSDKTNSEEYMVGWNSALIAVENEIVNNFEITSKKDLINHIKTMVIS